ncbi:bifunctional DNA primase/polymerase [Methyloceanibacter caenitepidi]|uniref:DNA primase/polymerase bifunctional N-terminal domain-containing protein n=1 Tax=Methyloceanibacter caenitepidi TaxID=1384459 RepID=A0A0A8K7G8_9HYPH|nr:bifunctional DNA primase/polymerase [Methyloceanibacter caenitepidi]BAQ17929.1 hypothetical protein GL4_2495 [Methyloceanibacter caenitepidi]
MKKNDNEASQDDEALRWALRLASMRYRVVPVHTIREDGTCSCGLPNDADKHKPGKHPILKGWEKKASFDADTIRAWWKELGPCNWGVMCEEIFAFDKDGPQADEVIRELEERYGTLAPTWMTVSGRGGHILYRQPSKRLDFVETHRDMQIISGTRYILVPGSRHVSGRRYEWVKGHSPDDIEIAPCPEFLRNGWPGAASNKDQSTSGNDWAALWDAPLNEGGRNNTATSLTGHLLGHGLGSEEAKRIVGAWNERVCSPPLSASEVNGVVDSIWQRQREKNEASDTPTPEWPTLDDAAYYGLIGSIVRTVEPHSEADPAALLFQLMIGVGSIIGRKVYYLVEADRHHANEFIAIVGNTAKARKGLSYNRVKAVLSYVDDQWTRNCELSGLSSGEGLIHAIRDAVKGTNKDGEEVTTDPGVEDKRLLVMEAEFASILSVMERQGSIVSQNMRKAWDSQPLRNMNKNSPYRVEEPHVSMIAHITVDELRSRLNKTETANGFANRVMLVLARRSKLLPLGGSLEERDVEYLGRQLLDVIEKVTQSGRDADTPVRVGLSPEAEKMWCGMYEELSEGRPGLLGFLVARSEAHVIRLALIYAVADGVTTIGEEHLKAALALWDYCEQSTRYLFGDRLGDPVADDILTALRRHPDGLTRSQISNLFGRNKRKEEVAEALKQLVAHGLARSSEAETQGRTAELWRHVRPGE